VISAATSPDALARSVARPASGRRGAALADISTEIGRALSAFSAARYGRGATLDASALDEALERGARAIRRLRRVSLGGVRFARPLADAAAAIAGAVWLR
jgi:hypothetical protein